MLSSDERGTKRSKARVTGVIITNLSGTDKRAPIMIGKAKCPRCWTSNQLKSLPVTYMHSSKAWMTGNLFQHILLDLNRDMKKQKRNILLVVDGAGIAYNLSDAHFSHSFSPFCLFTIR
jgi:DDE superfamily endonuclease